jgi:hypothetical protein
MAARFFRYLTLFSLLGAVGSAPGCSSKGPLYAEDHARYQRIDAAVEALRIAYVRKDLSGIEGLVLPLDQLERLEHDIEKDFRSFEEISLDFSIERILVEGDGIDVFVHWQGQWKRARADPGFRERGHGVLRWTGVQSILLKGIGGDLPFGMAVRRPASEVQPQPGGPS